MPVRENATSDEEFDRNLESLRLRIDRLPQEQEPHLKALADAMKPRVKRKEESPS